MIVGQRRIAGLAVEDPAVVDGHEMVGHGMHGADFLSGAACARVGGAGNGKGMGGAATETTSPRFGVFGLRLTEFRFAV